MKKTILFGLACLGLIGLASCDSKNCDKGSCKAEDRDEIYTGVLPAADADGVRTTLFLDFEDDHNNMDGDFESVETYVRLDSVAPSGIVDVKSFASKGDFTVIEGQGENAGKKYIKLQPKRSGEASYYLMESDSTLVQVNADLAVSETPGVNYTLKIVK